MPAFLLKNLLKYTSIGHIQNTEADKMLHKNTKSKTDQAQLDKQIAQEREENGEKPLKEKEDKETIERQFGSAKE